MKDLSSVNGINLEHYALVNSKRLLNSAFCFEPSNNFPNHFKCCTYFTFLVRNLYFDVHNEISIKTDKVLVGFFLYDIYFKLKTSNSDQGMEHHFRNLTSYDGSKNVVNPDTWICWMVDKCTLSLIHVGTSVHTTTLCVPKCVDVDESLIKEILKEITELIKCSMNNNLCDEYIVKEACVINKNIDIPLHNSNHMFFCHCM